MCIVFILSPAEAATFQLKFFDDNDSVVGTGKFSFDRKKVICVEASDVGNCNNPDPSGDNDVVFKKNPITAFSATVQGEAWGFDSFFPFWWSAQGQRAGTQGIDRSGIDIIDDVWAFGDPFSGERQLALIIDEATDSSGRGSWLQVVVDSQLEGGGSWSATVVPIPAAVWLFCSGLFLMGLIKKRK